LCGDWDWIGRFDGDNIYLCSLADEAQEEDEEGYIDDESGGLPASPISYAHDE
jgi:hypothetical protein